MSAQDAEVETWTSDDEDSSDDVVLGTPAAPAADAATDSPAEDEPEVVETAAVPSPVAAAPPAVPAMAAVPAVTTTPGGGDLDEDTKADSGAPAPMPSAAPAKPAMASGSGGASGPGANGTCPVVCGPGVQRLLRWMTWKETIPGAVIVSGSIMLYSMNLQGISMLPVAAFMGMLVVLAGALVRVHNHFMEPAIAPLNIPVTADTFDVVGQHVACAAKGVVTALNNALAWDKPVKSASVLAHLWLVYRFSGILSSPTFWLAVVLAMFLAPITFEMLRPQLTGLYTSSLKPTVTKVVAKAHGIAATLSGMDRNRRLTVAAGVVVALLIVWQLFGSFIGLRCIASCALTTASFALVAGSCGCCCSGAACCPGMNTAKKQQ